MKTKVILCSLALLSSLISIKICSWLAENVFYDQFILQKSPYHGYGLKLTPPVNMHPALKERIRDLDLIFSEGSASIKEPAGKNPFVIVIVGDSMTYGQGVKLHSTFPKLLEKKLNNYRFTKVYVLARPGDDLVDNFTKLLTAREKLKPDITIMTLVYNDLTFNKPNRYPGKSKILQSLKSGCLNPDSPQSHLPGMSWVDILNTNDYPAFSARFSGLCILKNVATSIPKDKILMMTTTYNPPPGINDSPDKYPIRQKTYEMMGILTSAFTDKSIPLLDVMDFKDFWYYPLSNNEIHPSAKTHELYADYLSGEILNNPVWQFNSN